MRRDGRTALELRGKEMKTSECSQFDGSAWFSQGQSAVQVILHGPTQARSEEYDCCTLRIAIQHAAAVAPMAGGAGRLISDEMKRENRSRVEAFELEQLVESAVGAVFIRERFPRCVVVIDVIIVQNDGSLAATVVNAVMAAILDAGLPCRTTVAAISVAAMRIRPTDGSAASSTAATPQLEYIVDPTIYEEELEIVEDSGANMHEKAKTVASPSTASSSSSPSLLQKSESRQHQELYECIGTGVFLFANLKGGGGLLGHQVRQTKAASHIGQPSGHAGTPGKGNAAVASPAAALSVSSFTQMTALAERAAGVLFDFFRQCNVPLE